MPGLPPSSDSIAEYYSRRFGVPEDVMRSLRIEANKEEIWATTSPPLAGVHAARPMGLRIGRDFSGGFKPTSVFLAALGDRIRRSRVPVDFQTLRGLMLGRRIPFSGSEQEGYVALVYEEDVLGCGRIRHGMLQALIPTGRRKELLDILSAH